MNDFHVHSGLIEHTSGKISEILKELDRYNIKNTTILEHFSPAKILNPSNRDPSNTIFPKNIPKKYSKRTSTVSKMVSEIKKEILSFNSPINVMTSLEVDYHDSFKDLIKEMVSKVDYLTLSAHYVSLPNNSEELYPVNFKEYFDKYVKLFGERALVEHYFKNLLGGINSGLFLVVAHIDLLSLFIKDFYKKYRDYLYVILDEIIKNRLFLEINIKYAEKGIFFPSFEILNLYLEKGGSMLCLGSDSHNLQDISEIRDKFSFFKKKLKEHDSTILNKILFLLNESDKIKTFI